MTLFLWHTEDQWVGTFYNSEPVVWSCKLRKVWTANNTLAWLILSYSLPAFYLSVAGDLIKVASFAIAVGVISWSCIEVLPEHSSNWFLGVAFLDVHDLIILQSFFFNGSNFLFRLYSLKGCGIHVDVHNGHSGLVLLCKGLLDLPGAVWLWRSANVELVHILNDVIYVVRKGGCWDSIDIVTCGLYYKRFMIVNLGL